MHTLRFIDHMRPNRIVYIMYTGLYEHIVFSVFSDSSVGCIYIRVASTDCEQCGTPPSVSGTATQRQLDDRLVTIKYHN